MVQEEPIPPKRIIRRYYAPVWLFLVIALGLGLLVTFFILSNIYDRIEENRISHVDVDNKYKDALSTIAVLKEEIKSHQYYIETDKKQIEQIQRELLESQKNVEAIEKQEQDAYASLSKEVEELKKKAQKKTYIYRDRKIDYRLPERTGTTVR